MVDIGFTEAQQMFQREMQNFTQNELAPGAKERAKLDFITPEVIRKVADMGLLKLTTPTRYGGKAADSVTIGIAFEEVAKVDVSPLLLMLAHVTGPIMMDYGTEEVRQEWLPLMATGNKLCCFASTEPHCGSDAAAIKTRAVRDGESYIITGEKTSVGVGMQADVMFLTAKTDLEAGARGVTCFLMPLDLPGITRSPLTYMGCIPWGTASIIMDEVRIPAKYRLGEEGEGFYKVMSGFDLTRILAALMAIGLAESSFDEAVAYAKQRTAFGQPLAKFEGISFKLAEDATMIEAARLLCYQALQLRDKGIPHRKETAMAKWFSASSAVHVVHDALLTFGQVGYSDKYPIEQRLRDVIGLEMGDGTAEIMKTIIAREVFGKGF